MATDSHTDTYSVDDLFPPDPAIDDEFVEDILSKRRKELYLAR